jgi:hypothetical protein
MADFQPLINGEAYSWGQITVNILGVPVAGITQIEYSDEQEMQNNYGAGNQPVSRSYGQVTPEASITVTAEEVVALQNAAPGGNLRDIPEFDIVVAYLPKSGNIVTDVIRNVRFKRNERSVGRGDMEIEVQIPLVISHVEWGQTA